MHGHRAARRVLWRTKYGWNRNEIGDETGVVDAAGDSDGSGLEKAAEL